MCGRAVKPLQISREFLLCQENETIRRDLYQKMMNIDC